jgi:uncharacterized membrane protein
MIRKRNSLILLILSLVSLLTVACSGQSSASNSTVKQVTINAQISADMVSLPLSVVESNVNSRFLVKTATDTLSFMAYEYNKQLYIRADICPPCGSQSFTLTNGTLVCDRCGTVFNAGTGVGTKGPCIKFAKQSVNYVIKDGSIQMKGADLTTAFQKTLNPVKS